MKPTIIYVIRAGEHYKIGRTTNLAARIRKLQTSSPYPLELVASGFGPPALEPRLHRRYSEAHVNGEWFALTNEHLAEIRTELSVEPVLPAGRGHRPQGSVQHLSGRRWRIYVERARDPETGNRRRASRIVDAANRRDAVELLTTFSLQVRTLDQNSRPYERTVNQLLDTWTTHHTAAPSTMAAWSNALDLYIRPHIGNRNVDTITTETIERLYRTLATTKGARGKPVSAATIRKAHAALRLAFGLAQRWAWADENPVANASPPTARAARPTVPDRELVAALVEAAEHGDPDFACYIALAAHLGHRRSEALALQWGDIDLDAGVITIGRVVELVNGRMTIAERTKTDASTRTVALGPRAVSKLRALRARRAEIALAFGVTLPATAFVFTDRHDGAAPWSPRTVNRWFAAVRGKVPGAEAVKPHHLRHYMATQLLAAGYDVVTVAGRGGWSNPYTLLTVYAHWLPARDVDAAADLDVG